VHRQPVLNHIQLTVPVLVCKLPQLPQDVLREAEGGPELHSLAGAEAVGLVLALRPPRVVELGVWEHLPAAVCAEPQHFAFGINNFG
jgi:hypothetical protein